MMLFTEPHRCFQVGASRYEANQFGELLVEEPRWWTSLRCGAAGAGRIAKSLGEFTSLLANR